MSFNCMKCVVNKRAGAQMYCTNCIREEWIKAAIKAMGLALPFLPEDSPVSDRLKTVIDGKVWVEIPMDKVAIISGELIPEEISEDDVAQLYEDSAKLQKLIDATINGVLDRVAGKLGVNRYEGGDGSEDFWGDISGSIHNILVEAKVIKP